MDQWINYILGLNKQTQSELIDAELKNLKRFAKFLRENDVEIKKEIWDHFNEKTLKMEKTIKILQEENELLIAKLETYGQD